MLELFKCIKYLNIIRKDFKSRACKDDTYISFWLYWNGNERGFSALVYENKYALRFFTNNLMFNQNIIKVCTGKEIYICCKLFENPK